jgi:hypothetical protein
MVSIVDKLLASEEPSIRYKVRVNVLSESEDSRDILDLREEIKRSARVQALIADKDETGRLRPVQNAYSKWKGAHWVVASLADIGYPKGDAKLAPAVGQVLDFWLHPNWLTEQVCETPPPPHMDRSVPVINGRARRCASQQGNALFSAVRLGFVDERCRRLADLLIHWQWPDGGWNCDRKPEAAVSSFWESLTPLRALSKYARMTGDAETRSAADRAADLFLKRRLFRRLSDGQVMNPHFLRLHYPCYWHYDILFGLKVMGECGFITDPRCQDALDALESKRLTDGGWPAESKFYSAPSKGVSGSDWVSWGGVAKTHMNEWVTADALYALKAAGRLRL